MAKLHNMQEKLFVLIATGAPGAFKLLVFFLVQFYFDISVVGELSSIWAIANIIGFFTAIGWCTLLLVRLPKEEETEDKFLIFGQLLQMALMVLVICISLLELIRAIFYPEQKWVYIYAICLAWSFYQFVRHYYLSSKNYIQILKLELMIVLFLSTLIFYINPYLALFIAYLVPSLIFIILSGLKCRHFKRFKFEYKGLVFGFNNFLSGGVALSLIPIANKVNGADFSGYLSLFISIASIAMLFPKAVSLTQLPHLAKSIDNIAYLKKIISSMKRSILITNLGTFLFNTLVIFYFLYAYSLDFSQYGLSFLLLAIYYFSSTSQIVDANYLMCKEWANKIMLASLVAFSIYSISLLLVLSTTGFEYLLATLVLVTLAKGFYLCNLKNEGLNVSL